MMKKIMKVLFKIIGIALVAYAALFAVFFFDLDGKALFKYFEPFLCRHYEKIERKDPMKAVYDTDVPKYEYQA